MNAWESAFWGCFFVLVVVSIVIDARTYRIPNIIVAALALIGLAMLAIFSPERLYEHILVSIAALAVGFVLFQFTGFGAGDAKLTSAVALWLGAGGMVGFLFWLGIFCALLVVVLAAGRRVLQGSDMALARWRPFQKGAPVPLALAIGPAAIFAGFAVVTAV